MSNNHLKHQAQLAAFTVRPATAADDAGLERLAALDSSAPLPSPALVAEVGGEVLAAVSLLDGSVIADPFHRTAELVTMLRLRSGHAPNGRSRRTRLLGRSRWGEKQPRPSAPSVPGIPALPAG